MYNPENLELPSEDDPSLIKYTFEYESVMLTHVLALNSADWEESPFVGIEIYSTPYLPGAHCSKVEPNWRLSPDISFEVKRFDTSHPEHATTRAELSALLPGENFDRYLGEWFRSATESGLDTILLRRERVGFEIEIQAFAGLSLEYVQANISCLRINMEFELDFDDVLLLESFEKEIDPTVSFQRLTYKDPEFGAP